jgi:hypothetical protein
MNIVHDGRAYEYNSVTGLHILSSRLGDALGTYYRDLSIGLRFANGHVITLSSWISDENQIQEATNILQSHTLPSRLNYYHNQLESVGRVLISGTPRRTFWINREVYLYSNGIIKISGDIAFSIKDLMKHDGISFGVQQRGLRSSSFSPHTIGIFPKVYFAKTRQIPIFWDFEIISHLIELFGSE